MNQEQVDIILEKLDAMHDVDKWDWLLNNQDLEPIVCLDNDGTFITFEEFEGYSSFNEYLGWSDGVQTLLKVINIRAECV